MTVEAYQPKCNYINTALSTANVDLDLSNAKVLEIYGNAGQLLADPENVVKEENYTVFETCLLYTSPSPRDRTRSRMPSSA